MPLPYIRNSHKFLPLHSLTVREKSDHVTAQHKPMNFIWTISSISVEYFLVTLFIDTHHVWHMDFVAILRSECNSMRCCCCNIDSIPFAHTNHIIQHMYSWSNTKMDSNLYWLRHYYIIQSCNFRHPVKRQWLQQNKSHFFIMLHISRYLQINCTIFFKKHSSIAEYQEQE